MNASGQLLDPAHGYKPLDSGADGVMASVVDQDGKLMRLNIYHARHGYVMMITNQFPGDLHYALDKLRAYRAELAALTGFGSVCEQDTVERQHHLLIDVIPAGHLRLLANRSQITATYKHYIPLLMP